MQIILYLAVSVLTGLVSLASHAHEFWIEPSDFQPELGDRVSVDLVIGTDFQGLSSPYTPDEIAAFAMIDAAGERPITGRFGDMPAGQITTAQAGLTLLSLHPITRYFPSPGGSDERVYLYCALVDSRGAGGIHGLAEEGEDIRVSLWPRAEAIAAVEDGRIDNAASIIALQWLQLNRDELERRWAQ